MIKKCPICRTLKDITKFYKDKSRKGGISRICKNCSNEYHIKRYLERKMIVINHYTQGKNTCMWYEGCNISDPDMLAIDHINNDGAKHRRKTGKVNVPQWIIKNNFPEGFQILCHNHNYKKELLRRRDKHK